MCLATGEASGANLYGVLRFEPNLTTARVITISIGLSSSRRLIVNRGHAGPRLAVLAHDRAVANRLALGKKVVNVACVGIDYDRAWHLLSPFVPSSIIPNKKNPQGRSRSPGAFLCSADHRSGEP